MTVQQQKRFNMEPQPAGAPAPKQFRMEARHILYTWPQCDEEPKMVLDRMVRYFTSKNIDYIVVAREKHQDGSLHLHAVSSCEKKCFWHGFRWPDGFTGTHGNYQPCRDLKGSTDYVMKDKDFVVYPEGYDWEKRWENTTVGGRKRKVSDIIFGAIRDGASVRQMLLTDKRVGWIGIHHSRLLEFETAVRRAREAESISSKEEWHCVAKTSSMSYAEERITDWMNANLSQQQTPSTAVTRALGALQLYVHGPTGVGKTHLITRLRAYFRIYDVTMEEDWMDDYNDDDFDLIVMEEFRGQKMVTWMNKFIDGQVVPLRRKGQSAYLKKKNLPVIILSNYSLSGAYKNSSEEKLAPLSRRLEQIDLNLEHSREKPLNIL